MLLEPQPLIAFEMLRMGTQRKPEHIIAVVAFDLLPDQQWLATASKMVMPQSEADVRFELFTFPIHA